MNRGTTLFLRLVLATIATATLALFTLWLPGTVSEMAVADPELAYLQFPFLAYIYIGCIPFIFALYQAFKLLGYIDNDNAFSIASVKALKNIKYAAVAIIMLFAVGELYVMFFIDGDRAGIVALGIYLTFITTIIATFAAILQKLLQDATEIKSENDLTV